MGKGAKAVGEFTGKNEYKRQKRQAKLNHKYHNNNNHSTSTVVYAPPQQQQQPYGAYPQQQTYAQPSYTTVQTSYVQPAQTTVTAPPAYPGYMGAPPQQQPMQAQMYMTNNNPGMVMSPPPMDFPGQTPAGYPPGYGAQPMTMSPPGMMTNPYMSNQPVNSFPPPMGYPGQQYPQQQFM